MTWTLNRFMSYLEAFAPESAKNLPEDAKYQRYLVPAFLSFCLIDILLYGLFSFFFLRSDAFTVFSFGLALVFVCLLFLSRQVLATRTVVFSYFVAISVYFIFAVYWLEPANLMILLTRYSTYATVALLLSGRRVRQACLGIGIFLGACLLFNYGFGEFVLPYQVSDIEFLKAFLGSVLLSGLLIFALMGLYNQSCAFSLSYMEKQKQWHDSNRLTKEFVNMAGDMNAVMQGPLEDLLRALRRIKEFDSSQDGQLELASIKKGSDAIYGIARSFGVLAQNQRESCNVLINLDELVRYAQIVSETHFKNLGVEIKYETAKDSLEFEGPSGRWLLLLVSFFQFMADQIYRSNSGSVRKLLVSCQPREKGWELSLTAEGIAPFEFPYELHQKLKEESTQELLEQTSGKAYIYLLDRWGLKLANFQPSA